MKSFTALYGLLLPCLTFSLDKAWSPTYDQNAHKWYAYSANTTPLRQNHPIFELNQDAGFRYGKIKEAMVSAYARGLKIIDVPYYTTNPAPFSGNAAKDAYLASFDVSSRDWIQAANEINSTITDGDYVKLKIRINFQFDYLDNPFFWSYPLGSGPTGVHTIPHAINESTGNQDPQVLDIANSTIRGYLGTWTLKVLDAVNAQVSSRTKVTEVSLALTGAGESDLYTDGSVLSLSTGRYPRSTTFFAEKVQFYQSRENMLNLLYKDFATKVKAYAGTRVNNLKAAVFFQSWPFDGRSRGGFDLYRMLKGTGIDALHYTQLPFYYHQSLMATAFSASVASRLGIPFDTEFTWAHFHRGQPDDNIDVNISPPSMIADDSYGIYYHRYYLAVDPATVQGHIVPETTTPINLAIQSTNIRALRFFYQAQAGLQYGAHGITWANWTMQEMLSPPVSPEWQKVIGPAAADSAYLQELKNVTPLPYGTNRIGIYISTIGRMQCEEEQAIGGTGASPCHLGTYLDWFPQFGLYDGSLNSVILREKIDVITDAMIKDKGISILNAYGTLYVPFETSRLVDAAIYNQLKTYAGPAVFRRQTAKNSRTFENLSTWLSKASAFTACGSGNGTFSQGQDIGTHTFAGCSGSDGNGNYVLQSSGRDIGGSSDNFTYLSQSKSGDQNLVARVVSLQNTSTNAKSGFMIRAGKGANSRNVSLLATVGQGFRLSWRLTDGAGTSSVSASSLRTPFWIKLTKVGNVFKAFCGTDGVNWTQLGAQQTVDLGTNFFVGIAASGASPTNALGVSTLSNVAVTSGGFSSQDVGAVGIAGRYGVSGGTHTLSGSGADIWGTADQFQFAYKKLSGDRILTARVASQQNTNSWAKAGVMIRAGLDANDGYAFMALTPGNGVLFQHRLAKGSTTSNVRRSGIIAPYWVRIAKSGTTFTGYVSTNGSTWSQVGSVSLPGMPASFYVGMAGCSHNNSALGATTFTNVTLP